MKSIIEQLYYGKLCPAERRIEKGSPIQKETKKLIEYEKYLEENLEGKAKKMYELWSESSTEISSMTALDFFIDGFKIGAQFMMEVYYKENDN